LGDYAAARQRYEAWRADAERLGVRDSVASSLVRLGDLDRAEEDYALAGERYERASAIYHELKEEVEEAGVLCKLGRVARRQGDLERAASLLRRSLMMQRRFENRQGVVEALAGLAGLALDQEEPVRAAKLLGAAAALLSALGAPISPPDRLEWEQDEARLRAGLGPELWTNLQAAGAALDEAEADALRA
jgi:tetratricopeptide (TPR) repeat protein